MPSSPNVSTGKTAAPETEETLSAPDPSLVLPLAVQAARPTRALAPEDTAIEKTIVPVRPDMVSQITGEKVESRIPMLGDFRLLEKIGEGAVGVVYKAHQVSMDREVAVKVIFPHLAKNPKILERFYREARIMGLLDHPNILPAYAVGEQHGCHYLAMEYVDGASLQKLLEEHGKFSVGDALHVILACARALCYAHEHCLVHRDIKPDNILITRAGVTKLADFGMVKFLDDDMSLTQTGHAVGTPCYMPLEQARNAKESDARSDIYSLGCTLYCLLTGVPPFLGPTIVELIQAKELGLFSPARRLNPEVPERLDLIIDKMVAKDIRHRYQSCLEVIQDLERLELAHKTLAFPVADSDTGSEPTPAAHRKKTTLLGAPSRPKVTALQPPTLADADTSPEEESSDWWFVRYRKPNGQKVLRKLTTAQVQKLIDSETFDIEAQASRSLKEGYCAMASIREFRSSLLSRVTRTGADRRTFRNRSRFLKLASADSQRSSKRRQQDQQHAEISQWRVPFLWGIGLLSAIVIYLLMRFLIHMILGIFL